MHASVYVLVTLFVLFFFQAEDGIRDLVRSRGLGDVYKRQVHGNEITQDLNRLNGGKNQARRPEMRTGGR